jgi:hypothetical protein
MSDATHDSNESPEEKNYKETIQSLGVTQTMEENSESSTESKLYRRMTDHARALTRTHA